MNKTKLTSILTIIVAGLLIIPATHHAKIDALQMSTMRQKSMGGAGVALKSGKGALLANPAALSYIKEWDVDLPRIGVGVNTEVTSQWSDIQDAVNSDDNREGRTKKIKELTPLNIGIRTIVEPALSVTGPGFGFGIFSEGLITGRLQRPTSPELVLEGQIDTAPILGFSREFNIFNAPVSLGVSGKYITRQVLYDKGTGNEKILKTLNEIIDIIEESKDISDEADIYTLDGFGMDIGMMAPLSFGFLESEGHWGVAVHDLFARIDGTKEVSANNVTRKVKVSGDVPIVGVIGVGLESTLPFVGDVTWGADYKVISPDSSFFKNLHMGVEKKILWDHLTLRGGLNQGFIVGGVHLDLWFVFIDYAYYAEELGDEIGEDVMKSHIVKLGFFF